MGLESELYSETVSFPAQRAERAFAWALLAMQSHMGSAHGVGSPHTMAR
jgi:hypothetical protein